MKKISELIRPYLAIVFGALLLLYFLNWLGYQEGFLAIGIMAVTISSFYIASGILTVILGEKMPAKLREVLDLLAIAIFPTFMFAYFLVFTISFSQQMGPNGWTIAIISMSASLALPVVYIIANFVKSPFLQRFKFLFAIIFVLVLLLNLLFAPTGDAIVLGNLDLVGTVIYAIYTVMLLNALKKAE